MKKKRFEQTRLKVPKKKMILMENLQMMPVRMKNDFMCLI